MSGLPTDMAYQQNTCPLCNRTFTVTPADDILVPACGCYDDAAFGCYPCWDCGLTHVYSCKSIGTTPPQREMTMIVDKAGKPIASVEGRKEGASLIEEFRDD